MAGLYDLSNEIMDLLAQYESADTEEEQSTIMDALMALDESFDRKAEDYAKLIRNLEGDIAAYKAEADRLTARKRQAEGLIARLKDRLRDAMEAAGRDTVKTGIGKWSLRLNPVSCEVLDASKVPEQFRIHQEDKIDRRGLIDWYKLTGEVVDGVEFERKKGITFR